MSFTSLNFLLYFPITCVLYYLVPHKYRWVFLLIISYLFYINWQPSYCLLLFFVTVTSYICGRKIEQAKKQSNKKRYLTLGIILSLIGLVVFKYTDFIADTIIDTLSIIGLRIELPELNLLLPIGISFYTFMAVGYMVDIYRGNINAETNFLSYALFLSFFPQITSGPIGRANQLLPQLKSPDKLSQENVLTGLKMMLWGYFMKLCIADRLGIYVDTVYDNIESHNGTTHLLTSVLYTIQIYGDFAGYSLIAIGSARIMGIKLMDNFKRPYLAKSIKEFWSRWHISLSTWFRDYLYIPLGGNRVSKIRHNANLIITFLVSGLWHGAAMNFLVWGGIHGVLQVAENKIIINGGGKNANSIIKIISTFICVNFAWIFFRAPDISTACYIIKSIFTSIGVPFIASSTFAYASISIVLLCLKELHDEYHWKIHFLESQHYVMRHLALVCLIVFILLFGVFDGGQFIYFQF